MKKEFSIYLDLVRFTAALMVVIYHSNVRLLTTEKLPLGEHGHAAVIVFFILSGYVISYITSSKESEPLDYWSNRFARFYSLVIPAVLLCPLLDLAGEALSPQYYVDKTTHTFAWLRILTSLLYLNQIWTLSIISFSNVAFWSLCYEMWYYVMFAIIIYTRGKKRFWLTAAAMLLLGPKIMILAPLWALGVLLHRSERHFKLAEGHSWTLFLISWPLYALFQHFDLSEYGSLLLLKWVGPKLHNEATFSKYFLTDYPLALIISANFIGFRGIAHRFSATLLPLEKIIRWLSSYTFPLYLLHQPLLQFFSAVFNGDPVHKLFFVQVISTTLVSIILIGTLTERIRPSFRTWIHRTLSGMTASAWWPRGITSDSRPKSAST